MNVCLALDFTEAMHYSFLSRKELDDFDTRAADRRLVIPDPVSAEYGVMRDSLLPQMMGSLGRNASHQLETAMLFETGKVFSVAKTRRAMSRASANRSRSALSGPWAARRLGCARRSQRRRPCSG